jgi:hypothetical protein
VGFNLRHGRFAVQAENYSKRELEFDSWQTAYVVQLGFLAIPKHLFLAADFGQFLATTPKALDQKMETDLKKIYGETADGKVRPKNEWQARAAAHWYFLRNIGLATLYYGYRSVENPEKGKPDVEQEIRLETQYRF